jgi:hypothetical protein
VGLARIIPLDVIAENRKKIIKLFIILLKQNFSNLYILSAGGHWFVCRSTFLPPLTHKCTHSPLCDEKIKLNLLEYFMRLNVVERKLGKIVLSINYA